ncbi:Peptide chain release factor 2 [Brevundimonas subvibrioides]
MLCSGGVFDWDVANRKLDELNARVEDPTLWNDPDAAQAVSRERSRLKTQIDTVLEMESGLEEGVMLADMADEEGDEATLEEARAALKAIKDRASRAELEALLSGEADGNDAYLEVNSARRRHRKLRLGRHAAAHVFPLGQGPRL